MELAQLLARKEALSLYKTPTTDEKYVGVELEFSCPTPLGVMQEKFIDANLDKYISMGHDGGAYQGEFGFECRILLKQSEMENTLKAISKIISEAGGRFHPASGFHVHLDMRFRDPAKAFNNLIKVQDILYGVADPIRSVGGEGSQWCKPQTKFTLGEATKGKYAGINPLLLGNKNTIEVRIRESCVDGVDIYNWTRFLCTVVDAPRIIPLIKTYGELLQNVRMAKYIRDYIHYKLTKHKKVELLKGVV